MALECSPQTVNDTTVLTPQQDTGHNTHITMLRLDALKKRGGAGDCL